MVYDYLKLCSESLYDVKNLELQNWLIKIEALD